MKRAVLLTALLVLGCDSSETQPGLLDKVVPVNMAIVTSGDFPVNRVYPAIASPVIQVNIIARVAGILESRNFDQGHYVQQGDLLFVIEQPPYEAALLSAKAGLTQAKAQFALAQAIVARNAPLVESGAVAAETFDQYSANLQVAESQIEGASAQVIQAELNLSYTEIYAPISGRIGATSIDPHTYVAPGSADATLCTLIQADPIRVNFAPAANEFPEYMNNWTTIQSREVKVTIPRQSDWSRDGTISFIDNAANPDTSLIRMWTDVPNESYELLPGQYCEAKITMEILTDAVQIPSEAIVQVASDNYVWVVGSDNKVTQKKITVHLQQDGVAVLKSGLRSGDRIVVKGVGKLRFNGTEVSEAPPAAPVGTPPPMLKKQANGKKS
jgi:membrane fusion protein (multidrug efflux system)